MTGPPSPGRRELLRLAGAALGAPLLAAAGTACAAPVPERVAGLAPADPEAVRPSPGGFQPLGLGGERDGVLYLPSAPAAPGTPLVVMLHGAGGTGRRAASLVLRHAESWGCAVLAPDARAETWDAMTGGFGPDVRFLERALAATRGRAAIDPARIAVAGFSDGATYALALGRANGSLFGAVLAFSPGFLIHIRAAGTPRCFVAHGLRDEILPIDRCSRRIVPELRRAGYSVTYREFDGPHAVPPEIAGDGLRWFLHRSA
jgi:phospholipase/carboxylesterase